jgi:2-polyprenyl-3-methyl-5-hydroxy-6-metoxy-1,4-benzoquinol methylase
MARQMIDVARACWCGAESLRDFGLGYLRCTSCETLVAQSGLTDDATRVRDDDVDYYGKRYWLEHQRDELGLPDIYTRARQDLPERCVHWLKALLRYRQPPARVLEVGAGHGAYTALLAWAGYDATALDLSPWVAEFAGTRFGVRYLVGPVEEQQLEPRSFDVVVANDVLEHLARPETTIRRCAELMKPDGVLVVQTPEYPSGRSYDQLVADDDLFLEHMRAPSKEHLYLFSRRGLERLLRDVGLVEVSFEEPIYPYDMLCVASASPLARSSSDPSELLGTASTAPLILALVDAHDALRDSDAALKESEADRQARLEAIEQLDAALKESEADRQAQLEAIEQLDAALKESEADRQARLEVIEQLDAALKESEADRQARLEVIEQLDAALKQSEARR